MWVSDTGDDKLYAHSMEDRSRGSGKDFNTLGSGNTITKGIWSNGETMWVADDSSDRIYA